jgi:hypothetical protein
MMFCETFPCEALCASVLSSRLPLYSANAKLVEKQYKLEEQRKAEEKKTGSKDDKVVREGEDRRKKGRVNRWINLALGSLGG